MSPARTIRKTARGKQSSTAITPWWQTHFDAQYLHEYEPLFDPVRDRKEVARLVDLLAEFPAGSRLLDCPCGQGRHAHLLAELIGSRRMHVNLLRYNPTGLSLRGIAYEPSSDETAEAFAEVLRARKLVAHFRRSRGPDIDAACGQLRRRVARLLMT